MEDTGHLAIIGIMVTSLTLFAGLIIAANKAALRVLRERLTYLEARIDEHVHKNEMDYNKLDIKISAELTRVVAEWHHNHQLLVDTVTRNGERIARLEG